MAIFTMAIGYLREHLMRLLDAMFSGNVERRDVMFVITVPANSNDTSLQFMEEAAIAVCYFYFMYLFYFL